MNFGKIQTYIKEKSNKKFLPKAGIESVKTFWIIGLATDIRPIPPKKKK
jgi:hypothetical protein